MEETYLLREQQCGGVRVFSLHLIISKSVSFNMLMLIIFNVFDRGSYMVQGTLQPENIKNASIYFFSSIFSRQFQISQDITSFFVVFHLFVNSSLLIVRCHSCFILKYFVCRFTCPSLLFFPSLSDCDFVFWTFDFVFPLQSLDLFSVFDQVLFFLLTSVCVIPWNGDFWLTLVGLKTVSFIIFCFFVLSCLLLAQNIFKNRFFCHLKRENANVAEWVVFCQLPIVAIPLLEGCRFSYGPGAFLCMFHMLCLVLWVAGRSLISIKIK